MLSFIAALMVVALAGPTVPAQAAQQPAQGILEGVGSNQRTLEVGYTAGGCVGTATPSVAETPRTVTISLSQEVDTTPGIPCTTELQFRALTVTLARPLAGRAIRGLTLRGGAFNLTSLAPPGAPRLPGLVGLSPTDAGAMLTAPAPASPGAGGSFLYGGYPVTVVVRRTGRHRAGVLPRVVAQNPAVGRPILRHMRVILTIAR